MTTFTNINKSSAPTFSNQNKSNQTTFGELALSVIEANTFDGLFQGRPLDDWADSDVVGDLWTNQSKS